MCNIVHIDGHQDKQKMDSPRRKSAKTMPTFCYVPGYAVLAVQKPAKTRPIKSIFIMHSLQVIEEEFKREHKEY